MSQLAADGEFGHGWRGLEAAARGYFGKPPDALTAAEAALLAAVLERGARVDPWCDPERAIAERNHVLERMGPVGTLSSGVLDDARRRPLDLAPGECPAGRL